MREGRGREGSSLWHTQHVVVGDCQDMDEDEQCASLPLGKGTVLWRAEGASQQWPYVRLHAVAKAIFT